MFFYLYDSLVLDKKNETILRQIESRIIELGINGRVERLTSLRNLKEIIDTGLKHKAHTFVIVGSDATWLRAMNLLADQPVALGLIPVGATSQLAPLFGVQQASEACNVLSRRVTKLIPVLKVNQNHVLTEVTADIPTGTVLRCNDAFRIVTQQSSRLHIMNLGKVIGYKDVEQWFCPAPHAITIALEPAQTKLHLWSRPSRSRVQTSRLVVNKLTLQHPDQAMMVQLDGTIVLKSPLTITVKPKALKVIVGKQRRLA